MVYVLVRLGIETRDSFVEITVERQQQFIANAKYEIKTPLAVLSGQYGFHCHDKWKEIV